MTLFALPRHLPAGRAAAAIALAFLSFVSVVALLATRVTARIATLGISATCAGALVAGCRRKQAPAARRVPSLPPDPMARLVSEARFLERLRHELRRRDGSQCAVIVIEPRKPPTDEAAAARTMAWAITGAARSIDVACRLDGLRFATLLRDAPPEISHYVAGRIRRALAAVEASPDILLGVAQGSGGWAAAVVGAAVRAMERSRATPRTPSVTRLAG